MIDTELLQELIQSMQAFDGTDELHDDPDAEPALDPDSDLEAAILAADDHPMTRRIVSLVDALDVEQRAELVALMWLGRGDFTADEWDLAIEEALERGQDHAGAYLVGTPMLADYWREGAALIGLDLDE